MFPSQAYKCQPGVFSKGDSNYTAWGLPTGAPGGEPGNRVDPWLGPLLTARGAPGEVAQGQEQELREEGECCQRLKGPLNQRLEGGNHTMPTECGL